MQTTCLGIKHCDEYMYRGKQYNVAITVTIFSPWNLILQNKLQKEIGHPTGLHVLSISECISQNQSVWGSDSPGGCGAGEWFPIQAWVIVFLSSNPGSATSHLGAFHLTT